MDLMVNPQITGFRQDVDGTIKELKLGEAKEDAWANIVEQGASAKLDNNKTATINVSTYTEPVEITPTAGKDGMKKATITLSNIPSPGSGVLYAWNVGGESTPQYRYTNFSTAPETLSGDELVIYADRSVVESGSIETNYQYQSATKFEYKGTTYERDDTKDITL